MRARGKIVAAAVAASAAIGFGGSGLVSANAQTPKASLASASSSSVYKISTSSCTSPSAATKKITGTLTLGWSGPFSGPIAPFATAVVQGATDRFNVTNNAGGIDGVKLAVESKDDQFNPAMSKANIDQFISQGNVQVATLFGSGNLAAVAADQNLACLPLLLANATDNTYRNISKYPWTTEFLPANNVEEGAEAKVIKAAFPKAKTITVAIAEDETGSGASYVDGLKAAIKGTNIKIVATAPLTDANAAAITLKASHADVLFDAGVVPECLGMTEAAAKAGWSPKLFIQTSNCGSAQLMFQPAGAAANGQKLVFWEKDPGNPLYAKDPGYTSYVANATKVDPKALVENTYYETGWMIADMMINSFKVAAASPLGLSEAGIMQAARNQNYQPPLFIKGVRWIMNAKEAYGMMTMQPLVYSATTKSFHYSGKLIDTCPAILGSGNCPTGL
jgi:ABC-type branched-subunit amino acid transport system substrate-binding protein